MLPPPLAVPLCLLVLQIFRPAARQHGLCTNAIPGRGEARAGRTARYPHGIAPGQPVGAGQGRWGPAALNPGGPGTHSSIPPAQPSHASRRQGRGIGRARALPFPPAASFPHPKLLLHFILLLFSAANKMGTVPRALTRCGKQACGAGRGDLVVGCRWEQLWDRGKEIPWDFLPLVPSSIKSHWTVP